MRSLLVLAAFATLATPAAAQDPGPCSPAAPVTRSLTATTFTPGVIDLYFFLAEARPVTFYECRDGRATPLGVRAQPGNVTSLGYAARWRCDRLVRSFAATATLPSGEAVRGVTDIRTRSCAERYALDVPARVRRGAPARIRLFDRFELGGVRARLCVTAPGARRRCGPLRLAPTVNVARRTLRPRRRGRWRIAVRAPHARLAETMAVGVRAPRRRRLPVVLAAGDSTMFGTEAFLADDLLGRADVVTKAIPGIGISAGNAWQRYAEQQAKQVRPDVAVISIGANEGFPMNGRDCCDDAWVAEYARRLRRSVDTYRAAGTRRVLLLTVQLPRAAERVPVFQATNRAIASLEDAPGVDVLRLDAVFTPNGYQETISYRGRDVDVREPDGIHLNPAGTAIAARLITAAVVPLLAR